LIRYRLDTNVLVRFLTHDDMAQAAKADALFQQAAQGHSLLFLGKIVLVETAWVLQSVYEQPRNRIAESLAKLVVKPGIRCEDGQVTIDALYRFKETNLDIVDCFLAAESAADGDAVATFDKAFSKFSDVQLWDHEEKTG
jgi:predicted nucleic-acid-binding protein